MAPQPWNLGPGRADFTSLGNLGSTFFNAFDKAKERQTLANLGQQIQAGDYEGASRSAFAAGDAGTGLGLLKLRQAEKDRDAERQFLNSLGGGGAAQPSAAPVALGNPNEIETRFVNTVKGAGLTNPVGLGAVAAYGKAESGFSPQNVNRTWSDPSESGQPGTAGGIMSWRADRLANLQAFAQQRGEQQPSVETQALFLAQENPQLIPALQAAKTPQEANQIMANAWRFAGYDRPGGENARRLALTQGYAQRFGGQAGPAPAVPVRVAENEADVQRLEAQQGNPTVDAPAPVQVAQAPMQAGASASDAPNVPAPGAAEAQGFAIPGTDTVVPQSLMNDPQVQRFSRLLMAAPTERARAAVKGQLDLAIKDAERRVTRSQAQVRPLMDPQERARYGIPAEDTSPYQVDGNGRVSAIGGNKTTVSINQKGETKFEEELGKKQADRWNGYIAEGDKAQGRLADIQTLRETSRRLGPQGSQANLKLLIGPFAESLGIQVEGLPDIQLYESIANRLAPQMRAPGSGATSDIEFKGFLRAIGPLSNNPAAREMIFDTFEAASRNDLARADIASRLASGDINRGQAEKELRALPTPLEAFREFRKQNPDLVGQAIKESARVDHEQRNAPPITSADAYSKLKPGDKYTDPDGNIRTKR